MTLQEWSVETGISVETVPSGARLVYMVADAKGPGCRALWHLEDYVVSSVIGPVVWLSPGRALHATTSKPG
jgi:hypothetical protein